MNEKPKEVEIFIALLFIFPLNALFIALFQEKYFLKSLLNNSSVTLIIIIYSFSPFLHLRV